MDRTGSDFGLNQKRDLKSNDLSVKTPGKKSVAKKSSQQSDLLSRINSRCQEKFVQKSLVTSTRRLGSAA